MKRAGNRESEMGNRKGRSAARRNMVPIGCRSKPKPTPCADISIAPDSPFPIPDSQPL
jgi:hypothetical protein